jgi:hypothetical protein
MEAKIASSTELKSKNYITINHYEANYMHIHTITNNDNTNYHGVLQD